MQLSSIMVGIERGLMRMLGMDMALVSDLLAIRWLRRGNLVGVLVRLVLSASGLARALHSSFRAHEQWYHLSNNSNVLKRAQYSRNGARAPLRYI